MSFPDNTNLSIVPAGGAASSASKKHAILIRMSPDVLSLLEGSSKDTHLEVDLGENKGLFINGVFHQFNPGRESSNAAADEIYLRAFHQDKQPSAPLKYYATVSTKYEIGATFEGVQQRLRAKQDEMLQQKQQRHTIVLDPTELPKQPPKKKKKDAPVKKPAPPARSLVVPPKPPGADTPRNFAVPSTSQPRKAASPVPRPATSTGAIFTEGYEVARLRIIHCVALKVPTVEQLLFLTARDKDRAYEEEVTKVLRQIADPVPDSDPVRYKLKSRLWLEVRPYEWTSLKEPQRLQLLKKMTVALRQMGIPETHSIWKHMKPVEPAQGGPSSSTTASSSKHGLATSVPARAAKEETRSASSRDAKQKAKAAESRRQAADTVIAKDESVRSHKDTKLSAQDAEASSSSTANSPQSRRLPGSGYKSKAGSSTPAPSAPEAPTPSLPPLAFKKERLSEARDGGKDGRSARPASPLPNAQSRGRSGSNASLAGVAVQKRPREPEPSRERGAASIRPITVNKRKKSPAPDYDSDYPDTDGMVKRRKVDEKARKESRQDRGKGRESEALPSKPAKHLTPPPVRVKKEASPMPPPLHSPLPNGRGKERQPSVSSTNGRPELDRRDRGNSKQRWESVQYTSSEDDSDAQRPLRERTAKDWVYDLINKPPFKPVRPIPQDLRGLGRYYSKVYDIYEVLVSKHRKLRALLQQRTEDSSSDPRSSDLDDSDLDPDMMPVLVDEYRRVHGELRKILDLNEQLLRKKRHANEQSV